MRSPGFGIGWGKKEEVKRVKWWKVICESGHKSEGKGSGHNALDGD